jgi:nitroimidazol reductase NimA-like FMN-containing flavoprotein (pyridoxamine 5'-phosphate oxidase superfamily)
MHIKDMSRETSLSLLGHMRLGHIACTRGLQPYVTPFSFAYHEGYLYSFGTVGKKIDWMRANPLVSVEVEHIVSADEWQTVVIAGHFEELDDTPEASEARAVAHDLLAVNADWWQPGYVKTLSASGERPLSPVYFRIAIDEITGHEGVAD